MGPDGPATCSNIVPTERLLCSFSFRHFLCKTLCVKDCGLCSTPRGRLALLRVGAKQPRVCSDSSSYISLGYRFRTNDACSFP
eukprot:6193997-Pleurochrysis_carterae.AAC.1